MEEMVVAFYNILVLVQNMEKARSAHSSGVASPTGGNGSSPRGVQKRILHLCAP